MAIKAHFVTPIERHFPGPVPGAILLLNRSGDLSLYRRCSGSSGELKHVWSLGRFKALQQVEWSPDGRLIAVLGSKKCFIYEAEEGKRVGAIEAFETSLIRWAALGQEAEAEEEEIDANLLALVDVDNFVVRWSIDGEFALPEAKLSLTISSGPIAGFQVNSTCLSALQADGTMNSFTPPFIAGQIGSLAALSRGLQGLARVFGNVFEGLGRLNRFSSEELLRDGKLCAQGQRLRDLLLFGGVWEEATAALMTEHAFLELKQRLKKLHAELLVSLSDAQASTNRFRAQFDDAFGGQETARLADELLPQLEQASRAAQHELAEFLVWLEPLVLGQSPVTVEPLQPQDLALSVIKGLLQSDGRELIPLADLRGAFEGIKLVLDGRFAALLGSGPTAKEDHQLQQQRLLLLPQSTFKHPPGTRLLSACGVVCLPDGQSVLSTSGLPVKADRDETTCTQEVDSVVINGTFIEINP